MELPQDLRTAIDRELAHISPRELTAIAQELSRRYREGLSTEGEGYLSSPMDITAYAAFRMPATYAAVIGALNQLGDFGDRWRPKDMLDVGAGPGTAMWAATAAWPQLEKITLLERDKNMMALGKRLASSADAVAIREASWVSADITGDWRTEEKDLIIASYSLGELSSEAMRKIIVKLWSITKGILVIIEPGTPVGFGRLKAAREILIREGAKTIAPCPHDIGCPLLENDWCHFSQRVARSRLHRQVKGGELSYEDEKFTFIAMAREASGIAEGRVLRHPIIRKGHVQLKLCTTEGLKAAVVTKSDKAAYKEAKELEWGSSTKGIISNKM